MFISILQRKASLCELSPDLVCNLIQKTYLLGLKVGVEEGITTVEVIGAGLWEDMLDEVSVCEEDLCSVCAGVQYV